MRRASIVSSVLLLLLVASAMSVSARPVRVDDPSGDATPGLAAPVNDVEAADILAFQVGPDDPTHLWFSLWLEKFPDVALTDQAGRYEVGGRLGEVSVRGVARWDQGSWSYFLLAEGGGRTVDVLATGAVDEGERRVDVGVPRFRVGDPAANATFSGLFATSLVGIDTVVTGCVQHACDRADTDEVFRFDNATGTGLTFLLPEVAVYAGGTAVWNGLATFTGPDTTTSRDPITVDLGVEVPDGWAGRVTPARVSMQPGNTENLSVEVDVPPGARVVPGLWVVATHADRVNAERLPVLFEPGDPHALPPFDAPATDVDEVATPLPFAVPLAALAVAVSVLTDRRQPRPRAQRATPS